MDDPENYWHVAPGWSKEMGNCIYIAIHPDLHDIMGAPMKRLTREQAIDMANALVQAIEETP